MTQQLRPDLDWMLKQLPKSVPGVRGVVVLSEDGLYIAKEAVERETAEHLAAIGSGLGSLAKAAAKLQFKASDGSLRLAALEFDRGRLYVMNAGAGAFLLVTAEEGVDGGLMASEMRMLVAQVGEELTSPPRADGQVT